MPSQIDTNSLDPQIEAHIHSDSQKIAKGYFGHIDTVSNVEITGWLKSERDDNPVQIEITINGHNLGHSYAADSYRPDVERAGHGSGRFGFECSWLSEQYLSKEFVTIIVWDSVAGTPAMKRLVHSSLINHESDANELLSDGDVRIHKQAQGHIDCANLTSAAGWVKINNRNSSLNVNIILDGIVVAGPITADILRSDLESLGFDQCRYGFECNWTLEKSLTKPLLAIEVQEITTGETLLSRIIKNSDVHHQKDTIGEKPTKKDTASPPVGKWQARIESASSKRIKGWAVNIDDKNCVRNIDILLDGIVFCTEKNNGPRQDLERKGMSAGKGGVSVDLNLDRLTPGEYTVGFRLPDGQVVEKTISVEKSEFLPILDRQRQPISLNSVAVVVPVYNAAEDVKLCIEHLAKYTPDDVEVLFIDDASPDPAIQDLMKFAASNERMKALKNRKNLGFTATVNRGLREVSPKNVVILNSDARVTPDWLQGIFARSCLSSKRCYSNPFV
jgi:hypothetical protein